MTVDLAQIPAELDQEIKGVTLFAQLSRLIQENGLFKKQPRYFAFKIPLTLCLLIPGIAIVMLTENLWLQILNAFFLAIISTQIGFLGHDAGHRQIFQSAAKDDLLATLLVPLVGVSSSWWTDTHNRHHRHPNQVGSDPAIEFDLLAFSDVQASRKKSRVQRALVRYQAFYFLPLALAYSLQMRISSIKFLLKGTARYPRLESFLFVLHFPLYFALLFSQLSPWAAVAFILVHQSLFSLFLLSAFGPNHKGMPVLEADHQLDYIHQQVSTAQNLKSGPFTDFWFGGLNYQIEHHLFCDIPRNKLKAAQKIIKPFCKKNSIPYREAKAPRCYWDLLKFLHQTGAPLRQKRT